MTDKVNIKSERKDDRHQRYIISSNMNGRRYLHHKSPKKINFRWKDKHGSPRGKNNTNKGETSKQLEDNVNTLEQTFAKFNSPLHTDGGNYSTSPKRSNINDNILNYRLEPQKENEFKEWVEEERKQRQEEYDRVFSSQ